MTAASNSDARKRHAERIAADPRPTDPAVRPTAEGDARPDMSCEHEPRCRYFWRPCATPPAVPQPDESDAVVKRAVRTLLPGLKHANYVERWSPSSPAVQALSILSEWVGEEPMEAGDLIHPDVPTAHACRPEGRAIPPVEQAPCGMCSESQRGQSCTAREPDDDRAISPVVTPGDPDPAVVKVLTEHRVSRHRTTFAGFHPCRCSCGHVYDCPMFQSWDLCASVQHAHVAESLAAAGFGDVRAVEATDTSGPDRGFASMCARCGRGLVSVGEWCCGDFTPDNLDHDDALVAIHRARSEAAEKRAADLRERLARVEALADEWDGTVYKLPPGYPMTVNGFCRHWFKDALRAALNPEAGQ